MPFSNNSMSQQVGTPKLKEEVLKMACVQMLRAVAIMWGHKWLLPDDISCHQKRCKNLLGIYITDMLCHSCVKWSLRREECRPDSRKWRKLSLALAMKSCQGVEKEQTKNRQGFTWIEVKFEVVLRYQPGLKKGEFSKFLISRHSDKAFQELSFKKNSTKKYHFSAKLLDVEVYYTLIVLITRWQVLSFYSNLCVNITKHIIRYSGVILSRNTCTLHMPQDWFKCLRKKRRGRVRFHLQRQSATSRRNR